MRNSGCKRALFGLMICVASLVCWANAAAAENFVGWHEDGVFYRFDNQTGEIHKLVKNPSGPPMWVKCEVLDRTQQAKATRNTTPLPTAPSIPQPINTASNSYVPSGPVQVGQIIDVGMPTLSPDPRAPKVATSAKGRIKVYDENDRDITDRIDDAERAKSRPDINAYEALHVSHTLKTSGDRIKGIVSIENKGNRQIELLELTMTVRIVGKEKPIEHKRFILADKNDCLKPPTPSFGNSSLSVMQPVDVPMPSGVMNGMPEIRVTYIRFSDRE